LAQNSIFASSQKKRFEGTDVARAELVSVLTSSYASFHATGIEEFARALPNFSLSPSLVPTG
jgi:hypothetical protein